MGKKMTKMRRRQTFTDPTCAQCGGVQATYKPRPRRRIAIICVNCNVEIKLMRACHLPARVRKFAYPARSNREIRYPQYPSEFEVQAYLYCQLRMLGYDARAEVTNYDGDCRFDIVVFSSDHRPVRIIEVKNCLKNYRSIQLERYRQYGIKVVSVCGMQQAIALIERAKLAAKSPLPLILSDEVLVAKDRRRRKRFMS